MAHILGSKFLSKEEERVLTKSEFIKVMRITGKMIYELEKFYFEDCNLIYEEEDRKNADADTVFNEAGIYFCDYFCDLALYNRENGHIADANEFIEIEKLAEKVLVHIILTDKNTTGFARIIGA